MFFGKTYQKYLTATSTKSVLRWSVFVFATPNRPHFKSALPGYRKKVSQNIQMANKSHLEVCFDEIILKDTLIQR